MPEPSLQKIVHREAGVIPHNVCLESRADKALLLGSCHALGDVVRNSGSWLHRWAREAADRVFIAERYGDGWRELGYGETLQMVRAIAASLLARGLNEARPIAILSGNSVDHGLLSLAAQYAGVPVVPLAEQYSLIPEAHVLLRYIVQKVRPAMVFVSDAQAYGAAIALDDLEGVEIVASKPENAPVAVTPFAELLKGSNSVDLDAAYQNVGPDTLAKILFTSGSTSSPKGVCTTHGMMCVNQAQIIACFPFLREKPPKLLDWLPWNHVFGGSHNFNIILSNGGSLYIDNGKPTKDRFALSLQNLREQPGTLSFNVPAAYIMLLDAMRKDAGLRQKFFADLDLILYAGASLPQDVWQGLEQFAMQERGSVPMMVSSWGMTETAPSALLQHEPIDRSGVVGVPLPGVTVKLLPDEEMRCELRVKGPNVMKAYYDDPEKTAATFDEEGYLITGDAMRFVDPVNPTAGLVFDGRISEDFKLLTGTWVHASLLRLKALEQLVPVALDVVIAGQDRSDIGVLIFVNQEALGTLGITVQEDGGVLGGDVVKAEVLKRLEKLAETATGSSTRIVRALVMLEPPSIKDHEVTSKGSLNAHKILERRADLVARLYDDNDAAVVRI